MRRLTWHVWIAAAIVWAGLGSLAAAPAPDFTDALGAGTHGEERLVTHARGHVILAARNGWVRYCGLPLELSPTASTIAVSVCVDDDFQDGLLLSDAYERASLGKAGTTWPSLEVVARRAGPTSFRLSFGYCSQPQPDPYRWHVIAVGDLPTGKWHDLAFSWGPHGQMIWVGDRIRAFSEFSGRYQTDPSTPLFRGWGLGCLYNFQTPGSADPAPNDSASPVSFRNLRMWRDQVWLGPRRQL